jgi:RNA recognition motif-containing protein
VIQFAENFFCYLYILQKDRLIFVREDREAGKGGGGSGNRDYRSSNVSSSNRGGGGSGSRLQSGGDNTVFVGNLDWSVEWRDLKDHMSQVG